MPEDLSPKLAEIGPRVDMKSLPGLLLPNETVKNVGLTGQLLSPKDGCGISKVGAQRIVGGTPAKTGKLRFENPAKSIMISMKLIETFLSR